MKMFCKKLIDWFYPSVIGILFISCLLVFLSSCAYIEQKAPEVADAIYDKVCAMTPMARKTMRDYIDSYDDRRMRVCCGNDGDDPIACKAMTNE